MISNAILYLNDASRNAYELCLPISIAHIRAFFINVSIKRKTISPEERCYCVIGLCFDKRPRISFKNLQFEMPSNRYA